MDFPEHDAPQQTSASPGERCSRCGGALLPGARFCTHCGAPVVETDVDDTAPPRRAPWGYADMAKAIGLVVVGTVLIGTPAALIAALITADGGLQDNAALAVLLGANLIAELFLFLAVAMFAVGKYKVSWAAVGVTLPRKGSWWLPIVLFLGALVIVWVYFAIIIAFGLEPRSQVPEQVSESVALLVLLGVLSLALAPTMEELFFRGFLFGGLSGRWGTAVAALGTGVLFAVAHIDPLVFIPFTGVGALFAWGYVYSGSLLASVIAHFLFNSVSFAFFASGVAT